MLPLIVGVKLTFGLTTGGGAVTTVGPVPSGSVALPVSNVAEPEAVIE